MSLLCRACLVARESFTFVLFENISAEEYSFCTSVEVNQDDELPKTICNTCYELLEKYSNFKRACIQAQNTLMFQNNFNRTLPKEETWINGDDDKFKLGESCEVVMSESKVMMTQDGSSNGDEDVNNDSEYNRNEDEDYDHENENYENDLSGTTHTEDYIENDDGDDDDDDEPLQELKKKIKCTISYSLLPEASKKMYIHAYESFNEWKNNSKARSLSEKVMLTYFRELSEKLKPSTLWSKFSMLRSVMLNNDNVDLKKYFKLLAFLKRQSKGFMSKKPKALSANEIKRFIIEAPDDRYLATKVALIFGITGACNGNELIRITMKDIETHGEIILIKIPDRKSKTTRMFTIHGEYYKIVKKYMDLRLSRCNSDRFFQTYRKGKCVAQVIGKNKMGNMTKEIAMYLGLPDLDAYSGSSFKKASVMLLENPGLRTTSLLNHHDDRRTKMITETCNQNPIKLTTHSKSPSTSYTSKPGQEQIFMATSCAPKPEPEQIFMATSCEPEPEQIFMTSSCAPKQEPEQIFMATSGAPKPKPEQIFMATSCAPKPNPEQIFMATSCEPEPEQIFMASSCAPKQEPEQIFMATSGALQEPDQMFVATSCAPKQEPEQIRVKINKTPKSAENKKPKVFEYVCELCKSKFKYKERYEAHKLEHQGQTVNKTCTICKKVFMTWSGLQRHTDSEHRVVRLTTLCCKACGKVFKNQQTLKLHTKLHELPEDHISVCDICGKHYSSVVSLKLHIESHNENRPRDFPCEHCGKKFFTKHMLQSHIKRLHTGQRYICHICNYPFTDKYNLGKHIEKHQGKKDHKCDICNRYFSAHSTLVIHKRIHSGERPYNCAYCPKAFSCKNRLIIHHRTHTGERPHRCAVCNLAFAQLGSMKRHMKTHSRVPHQLPTGHDSQFQEPALQFQEPAVALP